VTAAVRASVDAVQRLADRWGISPRNSSPTSSSIRRPSPRTGC